MHLNSKSLSLAGKASKKAPSIPSFLQDFQLLAKIFRSVLQLKIGLLVSHIIAKSYQ